MIEIDTDKKYTMYDKPYRSNKYLEKMKMELSEVMNVLCEELNKDKEPGSYYYGWQSNLACKIMDNSDIGHDKANEIACEFLDYLINVNKNSKEM
jgi:hypothetical protein